MHSKMKKQALVLLIGIIIIIVLLLGSILIYRKVHHLSFVNDNSNIISTYSPSNIIEIRDSIPMSDELGKKIEYNVSNSSVQGVTDITVKSKSPVGTNFEIYVEKIDLEEEIDSKYIKVYIEDTDNNIIVPTYDKLTVSSNNPAGRRIVYGYLGAGEEKTYKLRVWVSDEYKLSSIENKFKLKINVEVE